MLKNKKWAKCPERFFLMKKFLMMLVAFAGLFILSGCKDSPKDVAQKWGQAILDGNVDEANKYSTDNVKLLNAFAVASFEKNAESKAKFEKDIKELDNATETIKGDTAEVKVKGEDKPMTLKKVDGEWKVDVKK